MIHGDERADGEGDPDREPRRGVHGILPDELGESVGARAVRRWPVEGAMAVISVTKFFNFLKGEISASESAWRTRTPTASERGL